MYRFATLLLALVGLAAPAHALTIHTDQASFNADLPGALVPVVEGFEGDEQPFDPLIPGGFQFDGFNIFPQGGTSESAVLGSGSSPLNPDPDGSFLNLVVETDPTDTTGLLAAFESQVIFFEPEPVLAFGFTYRATTTPDPYPLIVQFTFSDFTGAAEVPDIAGSSTDAFFGVTSTKPIYAVELISSIPNQTSRIEFGIDDFGTFRQAASPPTNAVPEPATAALLGLGALGLLARRRRRTA